MKKYLITTSLITCLIATSAKSQTLNQEVRELKSRIGQLEQKIASTQSSDNLKNKFNLNTARFNPQIGLLINGKFHSSSDNSDEISLAGFQTPSHLHGNKEGFSLFESELNLSADVDDMFRLSSNIVFIDEEGEDKVEIEELFGETTNLPYGVNVKFGRFLANIGYLNNQHLHADNFSNRPIAYQAFLGNHYFDDGAQVSWLLPTQFYSEAGVALLSGRNFPAGGRSANGVPSKSAFFKTGGEIFGGEIQAGLSYLQTNVGDDGRIYSHDHDGNTEELAFRGDSNLFIADMKYSFSPSGNIRQNEIILQGEYFNRRENGSYTLSNGGTIEETDNFKSNQSGFYAEAVYKFLPKWRLGYRYSKLYASEASDVANFDEASINSNGHNPESNTVMIDFTNSEFSRFRLEYENLDLAYNNRNEAITLQYIVSIGAHPAHRF